MPGPRQEDDTVRILRTRPGRRRHAGRPRRRVQPGDGAKAAMASVLEPIYERRFIFDSYACRRGKGTDAARDRAQEYLRRFEYCLKTDVVRFFPNVDHEVLLDVLDRRIDDEPLRGLIRVILASGEDILTDEATRDYFSGDDLFAALRPKGLPIGNLTSQFFANVLLDTIDHFVKEELRVPGYVRYADDLLLFANTKADLWTIREALAERLAGIRLRLHARKTQLHPCNAGVDFLGWKLSRNGRRLPQTAIARFNKRLRSMRWAYTRGDITSGTISTSLRAWRAFAAAGNSTGIRRALWRRVRFGPPR
ncbi:MAG TPA: RNA-directed DNA polymerase [Pirellulales bacterium]|nr:RNA-directed DNA polymerase [Pirellulales bacterium]